MLSFEINEIIMNRKNIVKEIVIISSNNFFMIQIL